MGSGSHEPEFSTIVDPIFNNVERAQIWPDSPFFATFMSTPSRNVLFAAK